MKKAVALLLVLTMLLTGCGILEPIDPTGSTDTTGTTDGVTPPSGPVKVDFAQSDDVMFTEKDIQTEYSEGNSAVITLDGNSVSCNSSKVNVSGTTVTITGEGTFILRGTLNDGMIIVNAGEKDKPRIVLDGASVTSATSAALYVLQAGKVFVTLAEGKENTLANGGSFTVIDENNIDAAVFSKQDLTFNGSGSVTITSPAGHGIVCKDDLIFAGGTYTVHSASHGVDANDSLRMKSGTLTIDAGKDGIHVEDADDAATGFVYVSGGTLDIEAEGDGISAALYAQIENGQIDILAGGGYENGESHSSGGFGDFMGGGMGPGGDRPGGRSAESATTDTSGTSMKGLKADGGILISNGTLNIDSADDAIHSDDLFVINGGNVTISSGDDGIHAETDLTITAGTIEIKESYEGLEAVNILISGGKTTLKATDDGLNAAGGMDSSGAGGRDEMFGGGMGGPGRPGGMGGASNGSIVITGGELHVQASGDGLDANGYLEITGGYTVVCGPNQGDTATLDYDTSATISGGVFIGTGAAGMAQTFSANTQGVIAVSVGGGQSSGVKITVSDSNGKELVSYQPELAFSVIIFSTPELISGQSYHVRVGSVEGDITAN